MTGIERLRELADGVYRCHSVWSLTREEYEAEHGLSEKDNGGPLGDVLNDIADQIEREHTEDCFRMGERAAEGKVGPKTQHEMALSLLYDWERGAVERERARRLGIADDVSMSAYDLLPADERDAIAWVREHGGIAEVKKGWSGRVPTSSVKRMVESHKKRRDRLKAHALWLERKCHERKRLIVELNKLVGSYRAALNGVCERLGLTDGTGLPDMPEVIWAELDRRLMPEGMEWPRFEDGEPVCVGDEAPFGADGTLTVTGVELTGGGHFILHGRDGGIDRPCQTGYQCGQRVKRPAPKALDADGSEIREKCDAWWICEGDERGIHAERLRVETIGPGGLVECSPYNGGTWVSLEPSELYVNKPVPASDGRPLREGDTVWDVDGRGPLTVWRLPDKSDMYVSLKKDGTFYYRHPDNLTHERPESKCRDCAHWQKDPTADNMGVCWFYYHEHEGQDCYAARRGDIGVCEEFMPRGKALAERDA